MGGSTVVVSSDEDSVNLVEKKMRCCKWWKLGVPPTWLVISGALLVQVGFGLYPVVVKKYGTKEKANPLIFSLYRDLCCFPLLFLCALIVERKLMFPSLKMLFVFMLLGLSGMFGNQLLFIIGVYWAGPNASSAFQPTIPVWTTVLAIATCTEKLPSPLYLHTWAKLLGILMATGGAIELTLTASKTNNTSDKFSSSNQLFGYIALLGNTICMAIYILLQKRLVFNKLKSRWRKHPIYVTAYSYFFGALFMGLASMYYIAVGKYNEFKIPEDTTYALVYAVFVASAMCYLLITWTNIHLSPTVVTAFWPTQVLIATVASYFITQDKFAPYQYIGAVMLIFALFLVLFSNYMDERLADSKTVLRVDCCMANSADEQDKDDDERKPILPGVQVPINTVKPGVN